MDTTERFTTKIRVGATRHHAPQGVRILNTHGGAVDVAPSAPLGSVLERLDLR